MLQNNLTISQNRDINNLGPVGKNSYSENHKTPEGRHSNRIFSKNRKSLSNKTPLGQKNEKENINLGKIHENNKMKAHLKGYVYIGTRTKAGHSGSTLKTNQDTWVVETDFMGYKDALYSAVFDGHGTQGHKVSAFLKTQTHKNLHNYLKKKGADLKSGIPKYNLDTYNSIRSAFIESFHFTNDDLNKQKGIYTDLSGSTGVTVLILNGIIYCGNVGDSKAVLVS